MKKKIVTLMLATLLFTTVLAPGYAAENTSAISLAFILDDMPDGY